MFETIVRLSNKYPDVWTRSKQTQQYRCMDRHGRKLSDHLEWAERVWKQNLTEHATDTMFLLACIGIR